MHHRTLLTLATSVALATVGAPGVAQGDAKVTTHQDRFVVRATVAAGELTKARLPCRRDIELFSVKVDGQSIRLSEGTRSDTARMYGRGMTVEFRTRGHVNDVRAATVLDRSRLVVRGRCVRFPR